jgi:hypothetical protein
MHMKEICMSRITFALAIGIALIARSAVADSADFLPSATGFTLPNAQNALTANAADSATYATTAGSAGFATIATTATNATFATSAGSAKTATTAASATHASSADSADAANYAANSGVAQQAAGLTAGNNCPAGYALSVTRGVLGCVNSVTSITGNLDGAQIVGNITNVGSITTSGNIVSSNGYVYGVNGLFTDNAVFSNTYAGRWGGANATFNGNAISASSAGYATSAGTAGSAGYATSAGTANYASSSNVGILHQAGGIGDGSSFSCDGGYHLVFYDLNVFSTNNAYFYECIQNGH